jgi:hypothetical protein
VEPTEDERTKENDGSHINVPKQIVGNLDSKPPNTLEQGRVYAQLRRNASFEAKPAIVHFGGFQLGVPHRQKVWLVNVSPQPKRANVLQPTTKFFKFNYEKKGMLAMGMAERITIEFTPTEWRYYYDCVRVHTDGGNLLIPIHAYPVMNDVIFPNNIDFGMGNPLLDEVIKVVQMRCNVPIDFQFSFTWVEQHPDIWIEPMEGIVPAEGYVEINVHYKPSEMCSSAAKLLVNVSQFGFEPFSCEIKGSSAAGVTRALMLAQIDHESRANFMDGEARLPLETFEKDVSLNKKRIEYQREVALSKMRVGGISELSDPFGPMEGAAKVELVRPVHPAKPAEKTVEGIRFPAKLDTHGAVTYVLTQEPGKLKIHDLRDAIAKSQEQLKKDTSLKAGEITQNEEGRPPPFEDELEDESITKQMREFKFDQSMRQRVDFEKGKDTKQIVSIGSLPPTEEQVEEVQTVRQNLSADRAAMRREMERNDLVTLAPAKSRATPFASTTHDFTPTYDVYQNDSFQVRAEMMQALLFEVRKHLVRLRVDRRIAAIEERLEQSGPNAEAVGEQLSRPQSETRSQAPTEGAASSRRGSVRLLCKTESISSSIFPVYLESSFRDRQEVSVIPVEDVIDDEFSELAVPQYYKMVKHLPLPLEAKPSYVPTLNNKQEQHGAPDEEAVLTRPAEPADADAPILVPPTPKLVERPRPPVLGSASAALTYFRARKKPLGCLESDVPYSLRAYDREYTTDPVEREGEATLRALKETPRLSDNFAMAQDMPECFLAPLPKLLTGPVEEDAMSDSDEEDNTPADQKIQILPPPPDPHEVFTTFIEALPAPAEGEEVAAHPMDGKNPQQRLLGAIQRHPINLHERQLDVAKRAKRNQDIRIMGDGVEEFNSKMIMVTSKVSDNCRYELSEKPDSESERAT